MEDNTKMNLGITKQLNYTIYSNADRAALVRDLFTPEVDRNAHLTFEQVTTQHELEVAANFILYGKDPKTDKNFVQKKEIQIDQAHSSYKKKEPESLDAILEDPATRDMHEAQVRPIQKNSYKVIKPTISRIKDADIPGMQSLWEIIDKLAAQVKELKDKGETGLEFYRKNHMLISLRKDQYLLKDTVHEPIVAKNFHPSGPQPICWTSDTGYVQDKIVDLQYAKWRLEHYSLEYGEEWCLREREKLRNELVGKVFPKEIELDFLLDNCANPQVIIDEAHKYDPEWYDWEWIEINKGEICFENAHIVYNFVENYSTFKQNSYDALNSDMKYLIWEFEQYVDKAKLNPARSHILVRKIDKRTNEQIRDELQEMFGLNYSDNYISTIYKQMICDKIAKAAILARDEFRYRDREDMFKKCSVCGQLLLKDLRNFTKKQNAKDGMSSRCKDCDKMIRDRKKEDISNV